MLPPLELLTSLKSQRAVQLLAARLQSVQLLGFQLLGVQLWASSCGRAAARRAADGGGQSHRARILAHTFAAAHPKPFERTLPAAATAARSATERSVAKVSFWAMADRLCAAVSNHLMRRPAQS